MYIFKLRPVDHIYYDIKKEIIELKTEKKYPYYRFRFQSNEVSHFAVCPACSNPIQIIGLYTVQKPYARHYKNSIQGLAEYFQENYDFCPLKRKKQIYNETARKKQVDVTVLSIIEVLVKNFDKVIYFLQKSTDVFISDNLAQNMLHYYFTSRGYLYPGSTLLNIPLMFGYFSGTYHLNGRIIFSEEIKALLSKLSKTHVSFTKNKLKTDLDLSFCFRSHDISLHDGHNLEETLIFSIAWRKPNGEIKNVYEKVILFDPIYCRRLLNYRPAQETEYQQKHRQSLCKMALNMAHKFGFMRDKNVF